MRSQPGALVAMAVATEWFPQLEGRARREGKEVGTSDMVRAPGDPQVLLATIAANRIEVWACDPVCRRQTLWTKRPLAMRDKHCQFFVP